MKLTPHLVPKPLWGKSAAQRFGRTALWKLIRADVLEAAFHACEVCGAMVTVTSFDCHEVWDYDDEHGVATLASLRALCDDCHTVVHMGRAAKYGKRDLAVAQLCKVNGIRPAEAKLLFTDAMVVWRQRNEKKWRIIVAKPLLARYPQLASLESA